MTEVSEASVRVNSLLRQLGEAKLSQATEENNLNTIEQLIERENVAPDHPDKDGKTPFYHSSEAGNIQVAEYLLSVGANINHRTYKPMGWTPLHVAAWVGNCMMVAWLLTNGADPTMLTHGDQESPIKVAERGKNHHPDGEHDKVIEALQIASNKKAI